MTELIHLPITGLSRLLTTGEISARELVSAFLESIEREEPALHAFLHLDPDAALREADAVDRRRGHGERDPGQEGHGGRSVVPLLAGIPLAVKDVIAVEGMPATCGSRILEGYRPPFSATAVNRLRAAGAIVIGKTNTDEFAMGSSTENSAYGPTRNPWDPARVPGGSSGGSAVAVAARLVPAALGSDTGGSVRQPASFCGVTGLKPTYGRVSRYGLVAYGSSLDCIGPLARSAEDASLIFSAIAGHDSLDATSTGRPVPGPVSAGDGDLAGLRIGVPEEYFIEGIQPEVEAAVRRAIIKLEALGASVRPVSLPHTRYALPVYYLIAPAEASANLARFDGVHYGPRAKAEAVWEVFENTRGERFGAEVKRRIMLGTYALSAGYYDAFYGQAQKVRTLIRRDFEAAFERVDAIAAPVSPTTAFRFDAHTDDPLAMYLEDVFTLPANLAGVPGLAFPVGFDGEGLPVGMQLMGRHFDEKTLLRAAAVYQRETDWHSHAP
ncbi:MAG TPA: Asp-tRNA(Asn)/Glu-tRNA(Gln) amidotransferase subunit GatA [Anaerolineales bacterium]|nr:Asp-tRNA(Asn)/Glu-tRNA(Gln) amidotransferase subunit GatA [Anaerolineales bacterium]